MGFSHATSKDFDLGKLVEGFADDSIRYKILSNTFKVHPTCRQTQSPIDATLSLARGLDLQWQEVEKVEVHTHSGAINLSGAAQLKNKFRHNTSDIVPSDVADALIRAIDGLETCRDASDIVRGEKASKIRGWRPRKARWEK